MTDEDRVEFHGNSGNIKLNSLETLNSLITFFHRIRTSIIDVTGAKDVRPALMVDDETKPDMLSLNIFVHYYDYQPYKIIIGLGLK